MFVYRGGFFKGLLGLLALLAALAAFGCGSGDTEPTSTGTGEAGGAAGEPDVASADADDVEVISAWTEALAGGDVEGAADFFALPSIAENGPLRTRITDRDDAIAFNESLPCGAELVSAETEDGLTTANFLLTDRPGGDCGAGTGGTAATAFEIEDGKIVEWLRVPERPDRGTTGQRTI